MKKRRSSTYFGNVILNRTSPVGLHIVICIHITTKRSVFTFSLNESTGQYQLLVVAN